jgi:hypothetical protein
LCGLSGFHRVGYEEISNIIDFMKLEAYIGFNISRILTRGQFKGFWINLLAVVLFVAAIL